MEALIIAAGKGSRLSDIGESKPLVKLGGETLIQIIIKKIKNSGIKKIHVITGYKKEKINAHLEEIEEQLSIKINPIFNPNWEKPNGVSVLSSANHIKNNFFLFMSDHIFDINILKNLTQNKIEKGIALCVDTNIKNTIIDIDDVTKVLYKNDNIIDIGKAINDFNAFDTGMFQCTPDLFTALKESIKSGDFSLSGGIKYLANQQKAKIFKIGNYKWIDVDSPADYKNALELIKKIQ